MPNKFKALIVGTGRCGTGYMADALNNSGVPCGHEGVFNHYDEKRVLKNFRDSSLSADSAWPAAIFIGKPWLSYKIKIVHLVRNPVDVIKSFWEINFFSEERIDKTLNQTVYRNTEISPENQDRLYSAVDHYFYWNNLIENRLNAAKNPYIVVKFEDILIDDGERARLSDFLDLKLDFSKKKINEKKDIKSQCSPILVESIIDNIKEKIKSNRFNCYNYI